MQLIRRLISFSASAKQPNQQLQSANLRQKESANQRQKESANLQQKNNLRICGKKIL